MPENKICHNQHIDNTSRNQSHQEYFFFFFFYNFYKNSGNQIEIRVKLDNLLGQIRKIITN